MTLRARLLASAAEQAARWAVQSGAALPADGALARALAGSTFLADALATSPGLQERIGRAAYEDPAPAVRALVESDLPESEFAAGLRRLRRAVMADIVWRDLSGEFALEQTLGAVSGLADLSIQACTEFASRAVAGRYGQVRNAAGEAQHLVVVGMGKLGGRELNFSSDVDLVFLYPEAGESDGRVALDAADYYRRVGQAVIRLLDAVTVDGYVFRVDMRLRPFGDSGPLVVSFAALEDYLQSHGRDWERYAWVKARAITNVPAYASLFRDTVRPFVYRRYLDFGVFESLREMKALISRDVERRDLTDDVKLGEGGIREVEFVVQAFQLLRGGTDPRLQEPSLLQALPRLLHQKLLPDDAVAELLQAYRHLRRVENALQMQADQQTHRLPTEESGRERLALALDVEDYATVLAELNAHRRRVSSHFHAFVQAPEAVVRGADLAALWAPGATVDAVAAALAEQGFKEAPGQAESLVALVGSGYYRRLDGVGARRLARLLPVLVEDASGQPEAAATLRRALNVLQATAGRTAYLALLHENPLACRRFVEVCALGDFLPAQVAQHPLLLDELVDQRLFDESPSRAQFEADLALKTSVTGEPDAEREVEGLRQFQRAAVFRTALFDLTGRLPLMQVSDRLTDVAELILERTLAIAWRDLTATYGVPECGEGAARRPCGVAAIAYGKFGGFELGYGSDLDLVFLHDSGGEWQQTAGPRVVENGVFYLRLGQRILHLLTLHGSGGRLYEVDTRLRPSGKGGPMVSNIDAFGDYQRTEAWTWEHQALLHSRAVAGSAALRRAFESLRVDVLCHHVRRNRLRGDVWDMRLRMRRELAQADPSLFDVKRDAGGVADIEFLAQYWVLRDAGRHPALVMFPDTIRQLESVGSAALVDHAHIDVLVDAYREYRAVAHRQSLAGRTPVVPAGELAATRDAVRTLWEVYLGPAAGMD